jgi:serine/threonine protein kinase
VKHLVAGLSKQAVTALRAEAAMMANLRSPYIVQFYGVSFDKQTSIFSLVMELLPRGSLYDVLHSSVQLPWSVRFRIASEIAYGVRYLHGQQPIILHRDIKSLNVLLTGDMHARLTDFGLAHIKQEARSKSTMRDANAAKTVGSTLWMAPELLSRRPVYSAASDVYSLGCVFYELATRQIPFAAAASPSLVMQWVLQGERDDVPDDVPQPFADLIRDCWQQDAAKRPAALAAAQACDALTAAEPVCEGDVVEALPARHASNVTSAVTTPSSEQRSDLTASGRYPTSGSASEYPSYMKTVGYASQASVSDMLPPSFDGDDDDSAPAASPPIYSVNPYAE